MGKLKNFFIKLGLINENHIINENCLLCGKKLVGRQRDFCSKKHGSYYHNVKTPIKLRGKK